MSSSVPPQGPPPGSRPPPEPPLLERVDWAGVVRTDWLGPLRVAATILGVAAVLSVLIGLGLRPGLPGLHWTLRTTLLFFTWLWAGAFGADLTGHTTVGRMHGSLGAGTFPLTITIFSLGAGAWLFQRCTAGLSRASSVGWFAARTAVLTAIPPLIVSWVLYAGEGDVAHLVGRTTFGPDFGGFDRLGVSSTGSFFLTFALTLATLVATAATRRGILSGRAEQVRGLVVGPVVGAAVLLVALIPLGMSAAFLIWLFRSGGEHYTWHEWMNIVAAAIAFAPNLALWQLGLGAAGKIHAVSATSVGSISAGSDTGIGYLAGSDGIGRGVWFAVALAPIVLGVTAYAVVRLARRDGPEAQRLRLGSWVVSLLVVLPCLFHFATLRMYGSYAGTDNREVAEKYGVTDNIPNAVSRHMSIGPATPTVFLVVLYAAVLALLVALATRILTRESIAGLRERLARRGATELTDETITTETAAADASTGPYRVGEVVNGWRWDGTQWVPVPQE